MSRRRFTVEHPCRPDLYIPKWISTTDLLPQMNLVSARCLHWLWLCKSFTLQLLIPQGTDHGDQQGGSEAHFPAQPHLWRRLFHDLTTDFSSGTHHSSFLPVASGCSYSPKRAKGLHWLELDVQVNSCSRLTQLNLLQASQLFLFQQCPILVFSCWLKGSSRRKHRSCDLLWEGCREQSSNRHRLTAKGTVRWQQAAQQLDSSLWEANFPGEEKYADLQACPCPRKSRVLLTPKSAPCKLWGTFYFCTSKVPCGYQNWEKYSILR